MKTSFEFEALSQFTERLQKLADKQTIDAIMKQTLYVGAGIYADSVRAAATAHRRTGGLERSITLTQMKEDNGWYTRLTFEGVDDRGVPNAIKAAALEHGKSTQRKTPFVRPALDAAKSKAEAAMQKKMDELINKMMEV